MNRTLLILLLTVFFSSCNTEKKQITKSDLSGFWEQQGEGEIIEINDSLVVSFYSSTFNCFPDWEMSRAYFNTQTPNIKVIDKNTFTHQIDFTTLTYKKVKERPTLCKELTQQQEENNAYNFETFWHTYNEQYAFFKERNTDWNQLKTKYQKQFTDKTPPFEFYLLLERMVLELNDEHSDIEVPEEFEEQWDTLFSDPDTTDYKTLAQNKILKKYVTNVKEYGDDQWYAGLINNDLAYIQLNDMEEIDDLHTVMDSIINQIQHTKYCIIDLRFNGGGYDQVGLDIMSHFIEKEYKVFKKKRRFKDVYTGEQTITIAPSKKPYSKPVFLLTSPYTVSAAETTILATMNFPQFKRIGSPTNGALSDMLYKDCLLYTSPSPRD